MTGLYIDGFLGAITNCGDIEQGRGIGVNPNQKGRPRETRAPFGCFLLAGQLQRSLRRQLRLAHLGPWPETDGQVPYPVQD
jgi:hypothetical protein